MQIQNYLLIFSALAILLSWLTPEKWRIYCIQVITLLFLLKFDPFSAVLLAYTGIVSFYLVRWIKNKSTAAIIAITHLAVIFFFYKSNIAPTLGWKLERLIPLGYSYYSFRQIHYVIEYYKGKLPKHDLKDFMAYLFFIPTLLLGPINRFDDFKRDLRRRRWDNNNFSKGLERILFGYAKVVILGNFLMEYIAVPKIAAMGDVWLADYLELLRYFAHTYFMFAGFSDIAIGLALLMGFKVIENFNFPFLATNINDFWQRWHISLSQWCKDYVFTPIAAYSRKPVYAILASMIVLGLWHAISSHYLAWAFYHGVGIALWHRWDKVFKKKIKFSMGIWGNALGIFVTFHFVALSFVLINQPSWQAVWDTYKKIFLI